uniref:Collagen, type V, alpha 3b n=1 Tax=Sander lucioperca TaxID=283035 RepID=A0A8C9WZ00_SANLU
LLSYPTPYCCFCLFAADPIDVLKILELSEDMEGVSLESGLCTSRQGQEETDLSFKIDKKIQLSAPTNQLFPDSPFPVNFSVMTTVRAVKGSQVFLLSLYNSQGTQQLGVEVGRSPVFLYENHEGQPPPELYPTFRKINLADGKWHRVAYSVEGQSVTLYLDCVKLDTLDLLRGQDPHVSTEGVTVFGTRLLDEDVFEGDIQQLLIVADPRAAETYCQDYIPDCDAPLSYNSILAEAVEVSHLLTAYHRSKMFHSVHILVPFFIESELSNISNGLNHQRKKLISVKFLQGTQVTGPHGPPGPEGEPGPAGVTGPVGPRGDPGDLGPPGRPGLNGADGIPGPPGNIMLIPFQSGGHPKAGTVVSAQEAQAQAILQQTKLAMKGPPGPLGLRGRPGPLGAPGPSGLKGNNGDAGPQGPPGHGGMPGQNGRVGKKGRAGSDGGRGAIGEAGAKGDRGFDGLPGLPGNKGHNGPSGVQGPVGYPGQRGVKVGNANGEDGFPGAKGEMGAKGDDGENGAIGARGEDGPEGPKGQMGPQGEAGPSGTSGEKGKLGVPGLPGYPGRLGPKGSDGFPGPMGAAGEKGKKGPPGQPGAAGQRGPNVSGKSGEPGPTGDRGHPGTPGVPGEHGLPGVAGKEGGKGDPGLPGTFGKNGPTGLKGFRGSRGAPGDMGEKGPIGPAGQDGDQGPIGMLGAMGPAGPPGDDGDKAKRECVFGIDGLRGPRGQQGMYGPKGDEGLRGFKGSRGPIGLQVRFGGKGDQGEKGDTGLPGAAGPPGARGLTGEDGAKGNAGAPGLEGPIGKTGPVGAQGHPGKPGPQGLRGIPGPGVSQTVKNEAVDVERKKKMEVQLFLFGHGGLIGLIGPPGDIGEKGDRGLPGNQGLTGPKGDEVLKIYTKHCTHKPGLPTWQSRQSVRRDQAEQDVQMKEEGQGMEEVFASLSSMKVEVEDLRNPQGTYHSPARTCKELWLLHPDLPNGEYWIDPNQGCHRDSFKVFCNFTAQGETCLQPDKKFQSVTWKGEMSGTWYSKFRKGKQISYSGSDDVPVHVVQLTFLQLLSATAKQTFTYHCLNSAAWLHAATYSHEHALRFRGANGEELTHENTHYISALYDGCQTRSGQERTVLEFDAPLSNTLPIIDVAVADFGKGNQKFGFQVGPVCYNG